METILVTGSSGFLGYAVARALTASHAVVGFDRRAPSHPPPSAECLYIDLTTEPSLARGLDALRDLHGDRLASVLHLAAYYDFTGAQSPLYERVTVEGTQRLLRMLRERFTVEQFVFSSTMLVHAPTVPGRPITEESPLDPRWPYPVSKLRTEEVIRREHGDIPFALLRIAGVYNDLGHSAPLPRQIQRIYERTPDAYVFPGDLTHGQAMVHLDDVIEAYALLVQRRAELPPDVVLLIGEPETLGYGEVQQMIGRQIHGVDWVTRRISKPLAKAVATLKDRLPLGGEPFIKPWMIDLAEDHYALDISRARAELGWRPRRSLRETLPLITSALLADPWAWYRENELRMPDWLAQIKPVPAPALAMDAPVEEPPMITPAHARPHEHQEHSHGS